MGLSRVSSAGWAVERGEGVGVPEQAASVKSEANRAKGRSVLMIEQSLNRRPGQPAASLVRTGVCD